MKNAIRVSIAVGVCLLSAVIVNGQQQRVAPVAPKTISIGQPIDEVKQILKDRGLEFGENGFALSSPDPDSAHLRCGLEKGGAQAAIFYSKSKQLVTGMSTVFHPPGRPEKSYQAWLSAKSITLEPDGSYAVHFLPPRKVDPAAKRP